MPPGVVEVQERSNNSSRSRISSAPAAVTPSLQVPTGAYETDHCFPSIPAKESKKCWLAGLEERRARSNCCGTEGRGVLIVKVILSTRREGVSVSLLGTC